MCRQDDGIICVERHQLGDISGLCGLGPLRVLVANGLLDLRVRRRYRADKCEQKQNEAGFCFHALIEPRFRLSVNISFKDRTSWSMRRLKESTRKDGLTAGQPLRLPNETTFPATRPPYNGLAPCSGCRS